MEMEASPNMLNGRERGSDPRISGQAAPLQRGERMQAEGNVGVGALQPGERVEADGNAGAGASHSASGAPLPTQASPHVSQQLGPNNEQLGVVAPRLVNALRELVEQYRAEGFVARRNEIRRIRQARLFWQGLQYAWWNPSDMKWHLPTDTKMYDDSALENMPRYQFVTNLYQAFGLSFISLISQDVPSTQFYPQSTLSEADIMTAKAGSEVAKLIEQNNHVEQLLSGLGFYLWTDGKIGGYVRYVADGQRFGWRDELVLEERWVRVGRDGYACSQCGAESEIDGGADDALTDTDASTNDASAENIFRASLRPGERTGRAASEAWQRNHAQNADSQRPFASSDVAGQAAYGSDGPAWAYPGDAAGRGRRDVGTSDAANSHLRPGAPNAASARNAANGSDASTAGSGASFLRGAICHGCGGALGESDFRPAPLVPVPLGIGTRRVPNGQEVISVVGGLELNTPVWANEQHEFPYLQWEMEVHRAKLKAAYPHAADKIQMGGPVSSDDAYARTARVAVSQGTRSSGSGDVLFNLVTFSRTWIRPWAFYAIEDAPVRDALLELFPDGCYVGFAGDAYCESRNESMDDCWRVMHALPGDGQNRPSVGDSLVEIQERYNTLSNIQAETYEYGIPPIYADPQVLDFDALQGQTAEPAAHYPARARPGMSLADGFFQPAPAQVPPDMLRHQQDLIGPISQFLTGLFPAVFGGEMDNVRTASGYAMARDQALGRLGLVWRRLKHFYGDVMLLSVDCFRKNRPNDVEMPFLGAGGEFESKFIRLADLKGNIQAHSESDETFPRLKSQQRAVLQQLMNNPDPTIQAALREPANFGFVKSLIGLSELVVPGDDARNKQLREIQQLLGSGPVVLPAAGQTARQEPGDSGEMAAAYAAGEVHVVSTIAVDDLLDDHATEFEECRRWASSDAGQIALAQNPAGFANVRAHASEHAGAIARRSAVAGAMAGAAAMPKGGRGEANADMTTGTGARTAARATTHTRHTSTHNQ